MRINTQMKQREKKLQMLATQLYRSQVRQQALLGSVLELSAQVIIWDLSVFLSQRGALGSIPAILLWMATTLSCSNSAS